MTARLNDTEKRERRLCRADEHLAASAIAFAASVEVNGGLEHAPHTRAGLRQAALEYARACADRKGGGA